MNRNFIIIFGSAVTKCYRSGSKLPADIDVISDLQEDLVKRIVSKWCLNAFGVVLPLDIHKPEIIAGAVHVPVLNSEQLGEGVGYLVLYGTDINIRAYIRDRGFASVLRIYGDDLKGFIRATKTPQQLSLLPEGLSYSTIEGCDKYYSGLQAFRNAAAHCGKIDSFFAPLNCGRILKKLLLSDANNWKASADITDNPLPYGVGHTMGVILQVCSDISYPVLRGWDGTELREEEAMHLLFNV